MSFHFSLNLFDGSSSASEFYLVEEMSIIAVRSGWVEQNSERWLENAKLTFLDVLKILGAFKGKIKGIDISYQMHILVALMEIRKSCLYAI